MAHLVSDMAENEGATDPFRLCCLNWTTGARNLRSQARTKRATGTARVATKVIYDVLQPHAEVRGKSIYYSKDH